ncbi:MAG: 3-ketoacyl-ACP reductase [Acidobacteria bacterium]|nr:3-ketoacyl-ACP reductase [Acidobacteriota bacterium]
MTDRPVALVTGASRGIGRAIALHLARAGYDIAAVARPHPAGDAPCGLKTLEQEIEAVGRRFVHSHADVADLGRHEAILSKIRDRLGRIDLFVSNAGVAPDPRRDVLDMTPESFDRVLAVNLRGAIFLAQKVARGILDQVQAIPGCRPALIFITSVSAERSSPNRAEYCVSKAGLSMAARVFADRLAQHGIDVFEVRPGIIRTDMTAAVAEKYDELMAGGLVPERRWGDPDDVARAVVALARGDFAYSTGMIVDVSGGLSIPRL